MSLKIVHESWQSYYLSSGSLQQISINTQRWIMRLQGSYRSLLQILSPGAGKRSQVFFHTWGKLDGQFCFYYRNLLCQFIHALKNFWWLLFLHWNGDKKRERENGYEIKQCFKISQTKNEDFNPAFEVSFSAFGNSFVVWLQYS